MAYVSPATDDTSTDLDTDEKNQMGLPSGRWPNQSTRLWRPDESPRRPPRDSSTSPGWRSRNPTPPCPFCYLRTPLPRGCMT
ncbi:hypothetical protein ZEAMMB73_Zm00001d020140 [Zea mays]|uniref:Uncharacterized protein n=1 Tax=Zea mays TaxID=4577 RepID=A0A1D6I2C9_MAIZE|nr:hypothetical protein ZEAMMB73_Zm00001d020140 [Zea mays]